MITGSYDKKIKVWIAQNKSWILSQTYEIHSDAVWYLRTLPEIKLIASCGLDGKVAVMNYSDYEHLEILYILQGKLFALLMIFQKSSHCLLEPILLSKREEANLGIPLRLRN